MGGQEEGPAQQRAATVAKQTIAANTPVVSQAPPSTSEPVTSGGVKSGFGNGKIVFDKSGNELVGGQLQTSGGNAQGQGGAPVFSGRQAQESYLAARGIANTGQVVDQPKFEQADFSLIGGPNGPSDESYTQNKNGSKSYNVNLKEKVGVNDNSDIFSSPKPRSAPIRDGNYGGVQTKESLDLGGNYSWAALGGKSQSIGDKVFSNQKSFVAGSSGESSAIASEQARASKVYSVFENSDYAKGGSAQKSETLIVSTQKANAIIGKTKSGEFGWKDLGNNQLTRDSVNEKNAIAQENIKAFSKYGTKENSDYLTGGTIDDGTFRSVAGQKTQPSAGPQTAVSLEFGSSLGQIAQGQLVRGSAKEEQVKQSEAQRAQDNFFGVKSKPTPNPSVNQAFDVKPQQNNVPNNQINFVNNKSNTSSKTSPNADFLIGQAFTVKGGLADKNAGPNKSVKSTSDSSINKYNDVITGYNKNIDLANSKIQDQNFKVQQENQVNQANYITSSLSNAFDLYGNVYQIQKSGAKNISVYDKSGSKIGQVGANVKNAPVLSEVFNKTPQGTYYKSSVDANQESKQLASYKKSKNDLMEGIIIPSQQLGLKINLNDTNTGKTSKVSSESGYYSVIKSESQGKNVTVNKATPSNLAEIETYLGKQGSLMGKGNQTANPLYENLRGAASTLMTDINIGISAPLISLPGRYSDFVNGKAQAIPITNPIGLLSGLITPAVQKNFVSKQPETALNDILNLQVPKESPSYLSGSLAADTYITLETMIGVGSGISRAGSVVKNGILNRANPYLIRSAVEGESSVRSNKPFIVNEKPKTYVDPFNRPIQSEKYIAPKGNPAENPISALTQPKNIRTIGTGQTISNTNPTRNKLSNSILSNDNAESRIPISARPNSPNNITFENVSNERITQSKKIMSDLLTPNTKVETNPPASTNIPFYKGRQDQFGRLFTGNNTPTKDLVNTNKKERTSNLTGLTSSSSPINTITDTSTTGLSPVSSQFFGVQFEGTYPTSYLPPASGQFSPYETGAIQLDVNYNPASKKSLPFSRYQSTKGNVNKTNKINYDTLFGGGEIPKESVSAFNELIGTKKSLVEENQLQYRKNVMSDLLNVSTKETKSSDIESIYDEFGMGGIKPINAKNEYQDFIYKLGQSKPKKELSLFDILSQTITKPEKQIASKPQRPSDILAPERNTGKNLYLAKSPVDVYKSSLGFSQNPSDIREFLGLTGEKVSKGTGRYSGKLPLSDFGLVAQQGVREGDIVGLNKEGTFRRAFYSAPENTGRTGPLDILTSTNESGKSIFPNSKGGRYYKSEPVYQYGNNFVRGSLQTKDVGLAKFIEFQKKNPEAEKIGDELFNKQVSKLPKTKNKSAAYPDFFKETKEPRGTKRKSSSNTVLFQEPKTEGKETTSSNGLVSLLENPKTVKKKPQGLISSSEQQYETSYDYNTTPQGKSNGALGVINSNMLKSGSISLTGLISTTRPRSATQEKTSILFKNLTGTKNGQSSIFKSDVSFRLGQKPSSSLDSAIKFKQGGILSTRSKQGQSSKQVTKLLNGTPQRPAQKQSPSPKFTQGQLTKTPLIPPKKKPPLPGILGGYPPFGGKSRTKSGPTGIENLGVSNIFSSSLNISVPKGRRFEF